jgi:hypothetical protein
MVNGTQINNANAKKYLNYYWANRFFIKDNLLWVRIQYIKESSRVCVLQPSTKINRVLKNRLGTLSSAHKDVAKTKYRVTQNYYLPSMDKAIRGFSKFC